MLKSCFPVRFSHARGLRVVDDRTATGALTRLFYFDSEIVSFYTVNCAVRTQRDKPRAEYQYQPLSFAAQFRWLRTKIAELTAEVLV